MSNIPILKPCEVIAILLRLGFVEVRQRVSHKQFRDAAGRCTTVPFHESRDISPIVLRQIAKDIGITLDELLKHRYPERSWGQVVPLASLHKAIGQILQFGGREGRTARRPCLHGG